MKTKLIFILHFHQPVGNFDQVFSSAISECYGPILDHFERHPKVRAAFHFSGCLLEWLEANDRPFLERLFSLVNSGQVEPMGGGFYEPILPVISREDAMEQIERLRVYWQGNTGKTPKGVWLTERVWEPSLAELLSSARVNYTVLDDHHLRLAGLLDHRFPGYYATERAGKSVFFFPSDFQLRYLIPFRPVDQVRKHFEELNRTDHALGFTYGDDAEKFGFWPGTHEWVIQKGWLEQFFSLLEEEQGPVEAVTPSDFIDEHLPSKKVYMPNASYPEMLEWALPSRSVAAYNQIRNHANHHTSMEAVNSFVRGSLWDMFFSRYPESDHMHKHVIRTSREVRKSIRNREDLSKALTPALRAECNCAFWHGLFGGVYLPHLRQGIYSNILKADRFLAEKQKEPVKMLKEDIDGDGHPEIILRSKTSQAFFRPSDAGTLTELDHLPSHFNLTNIMSRWRESYHDGNDVVHEIENNGDGVASPHEKSVNISSELLKHSHFDQLPIRNLRSFLGIKQPTPEELVRFSGMKLSQGPLINWESFPQGFGGTEQIQETSISKHIEMFPNGDLEIVWMVPPLSKEEPLFGVLLAISLLTPKAPDRHLILENAEKDEFSCDPGSSLSQKQITTLTWKDEAFDLSFCASTEIPTNLTMTPIETLQRTEDAFTREYQGTLLAIGWDLSTKTTASPLKLRLSFGRLSE